MPHPLQVAFKYLQGGRCCWSCGEPLKGKKVVVHHIPKNFRYGKERKKAGADLYNSFLICILCADKFNG